MAGRTLGQVRLFPVAQFALTGLQLDTADSLDACGHGEFRVVGTSRRLCSLGDGVNQPNDQKDWNNEGEERSPEQLTGCLDGAGVLVVGVIAHRFLEKVWGQVFANQGGARNYSDAALAGLILVKQIPRMTQACGKVFN